MILVDERTGSADLIGHLRHWHVPCEMGRLEYGDACFVGNGSAGPNTVACGIEIKKVHDALNCMSDGRFSGRQLPGLVSTYDRVWLFIEGWYKPDFGSGILLQAGERRRELSLGTRRFMYRDLDNWLTTMEQMGGVNIRRTGDRVETARCIANLYSWWTAKDYSEHRSHLALHGEVPDVALFVRPTIARMVASQLPGVGFKKSQTVSARFRTVEEMVNAKERDWATIDGIGPTMAARIYKALHS